MTSQKGNNEMKNGIVVDKYGNKFHYKDDILHNEDGPAVIYVNGALEYWIEGELVDEYRPAIINSDDTVEYYVKGKPHSEYGPAVIRANGGVEYWIEGKFMDA